MTECERCNQDSDDVQTVTIESDHELCEGCREDLEFKAEHYYWDDTWSDEQHEKLMAALEESEHIYCAHGSKHAGDYIVHTPYVSSKVVQSFREQFGLEIWAFGPRWEDDQWSDCTDEHGSCFEIGLDHFSHSPPPVPVEAEFKDYDSRWLDDNDKQF